LYLVQDALNDCRDFYLATRAGTSAHTWASHARVIGVEWPELPLAELTRRQVQLWLGKQAKTVAASTANHRLGFLRSACDLAIEAGHIEANPVLGIKRLRIHNQIHRDLTKEEEQQLETFMPAASDWSIVRFAILSGLRRAEQFRLRVDDVDFVKRGVKVKGSKGTRIRWVPLNAEAMGIAKAWATRGGPWLFLPEETGCRVRTGRLFYCRFRKAVQESGIPRTRWIDLRHAFASRVVQQDGASLYHAQQLLGHTDPKTTMRYAHLQDQHLRRFTDGLR